jgi:hypothetical protein
MREVSSKMNLTDCTNPNYEDAVSVVIIEEKYFFSMMGLCEKGLYFDFYNRKK